MPPAACYGDAEVCYEQSIKTQARRVWSDERQAQMQEMVQSRSLVWTAAARLPDEVMELIAGKLAADLCCLRGLLHADLKEFHDQRKRNAELLAYIKGVAVLFHVPKLYAC